MPRHFKKVNSTITPIEKKRSAVQRCSVKKNGSKKFHKIRRKTPVPESLF